jgi:hypothetical protein
MLRVVGMKNNARVNLKINEPEGSTRMDPRDNMSAQAPASSAMKTVDEAMEDLNI